MDVPLLRTGLNETLQQLAAWPPGAWLGIVSLAALTLGLLRDNRAKHACLKQAQQHAAAVQALIAHEIRTPLSAVDQLIGLSLDAARQGNHSPAMLSAAHSSVQALLALLDDLLTQSKLDLGKLPLNPQPVDLPQLARELEQLHAPLARQKHLRFNLSIDCSARRVSLDPLRLRQILGNLLSNAIKYTVHGHIGMYLLSRPLDDGKVLVEILVSDSGIGMTQQTLADIDTPFGTAGEAARRRYGGNGLGLCLCRRLAGMMGGELRLDSQPGRGTLAALRLTVPREDDGGVTDTPPREAERTPQPGIRVLVVEDDQASRMLLRWQLERLGMAVDGCADGQEGLRAWARGEYDLVLCDMHLPRLCGSGMIRRIRRLEARYGRPRTPIVGISADPAATPEDCDLDLVLGKPVDATALSASLVRLLADRGERGPSPVCFAALHRLTRGDETFERNFIRTVLDSNDADLRQLIIADPQRDLENMADTMHRLLGVVRLLCSDAIVQNCRSLEKALRQKQLRQIDTLLPIVKRDIRAVNGRLHRYLAEGNRSEAAI